MADELLNETATEYADRFARYNVIAVLPNLDEAREALSALQLAGIEAANTSLLGPAAERAEANPDTVDRDTGVMGEVTKATAIGTVAGGAAGGVTGFLAGLAAFAIPGVGPVIGTGVWMSAMSGAILGGGMGGMWGGFSSIKAGEAWELTHELQAGRAVVGVHTDDRAVLDRGREILKDQHPKAMGLFDEEGRELE